MTVGQRDARGPVDIYCEGDGPRVHDKWLAARMISIDGRWTGTRRVLMDGLPPKFLKGRTNELLAGDELLVGIDAWRTDRRSRYRFECPSCALNVEARRENLSRILDTLAAAGIASISLSALGARLAKTVQRGNQLRNRSG